MYPISQSWGEGSGQFFDNPKSIDGGTWQHREGSSLWGVSSTQVFNGLDIETAPKKGVILYESFANGTGSAHLTESINDFNGNEPSAVIQNEKLNS